MAGPERTIRPTTWVDVQQGSDEWLKARKGIPTSSRFSDVLAKSKDMKVRTRYLHDLAAELITGDVTETFQSRDMIRGQEMEPDARDAFELKTGLRCERVGFAKNGIAGASPDSRTGPRRGLEIKTMKPALLVAAINRRKFPTEHYAQCQGQMWVCDWDVIDLVIYWPRLPLFHWTVERDQPFIDELEREILAFNRELRKIVKAVKDYGRR